MKYLFALIFTAAALTGYFAYRPESYRIVREMASKEYQAILFEKKISIRGLHSLKAEVIHSYIPRERSIPWWFVNQNSIEASLMKNSLVRSATVHPCSSWLTSWGCFIVEIEERVPSYLAPSGNSVLLLGEDGATISTMPISDLESHLTTLLDPQTPRPIMLIDMVTDSASSDVVNARFHYLSDSIKAVESVTALSVSKVKLLPNGELLVNVASLPFDIQFDATRDEPQRLADESERLKKLLPELRGKEDDVKKVDLAFDRLAVVTYTENYLKQQALSEKALRATNKSPGSPTVPLRH